MEIKELRIGNIINLINIGQCSIVGLERIDNNVLPVVSNEKREFKTNQNIIEPIQLTEEWLLKFGFEQLNKQPIYTIRVGENIDNKIKLGISIDGWFGMCYDGLIYQGINDNRIKHVHQLQNLYFALTNEELTWK